LPSLPVTILYVKEENPPEGIKAIEWFLMTNEEAGSFEAVYEMAGYYMRRWKIERFHYVLKNGCKIEELRERYMEKRKALILMYSVIAVFIINLTYIRGYILSCPVRYCLRAGNGKSCIMRHTERKKFLTAVYD
jgi:hypothetical protein